MGNMATNIAIGTLLPSEKTCYLLTNVPLFKIYVSENLQKLLILLAVTSAICKFPLTLCISQALESIIEKVPKAL